MTNTMVKALLAAACALAANVAAAQQCVGFGDVLAAAPTCPAIEWIKNRGVTLGCVTPPGNYCPSDNVRRDSMALFMQRLGVSLTPVVLGAQAASDTPVVIPGESPEFAYVSCVTTVAAAVDYPRKAVVTGTFSGLANASPAGFRAFLLMNPNNAGYQNFIPNVSAAARTTLAPSSWGTVTMTETVNLEPLQTYQFAVAIRRENFTNVAGTLDRLRCQLTATILNRNGTTSPL